MVAKVEVRHRGRTPGLVRRLRIGLADVPEQVIEYPRRMRLAAATEVPASMSAVGCDGVRMGGVGRLAAAPSATRSQTERGREEDSHRRERAAVRCGANAAGQDTRWTGIHQGRIGQITCHSRQHIGGRACRSSMRILGQRVAKRTDGATLSRRQGISAQPSARGATAACTGTPQCPAPPPRRRRAPASLCRVRWTGAT